MKKWILGLILLSAAVVHAQTDQSRQWDKRWLYISSNLYVNENIPKLDQLLQRAHQAGYNGVLFTDYKMFTWWQLDDAPRWQANAQKLRAITRQLDMQLAVCVFPFGYAGSLLWHDANLASGMPIRQTPMKARNGQLIPVQSAGIMNGSFESFQNHTALNYAFQDDPGKSSFIDTNITKDGRASLRFENVGDFNAYGHGRICQTITVLPFQQYRIRVWLKTEHLSADEVKILVMADDQVLQWQFLQKPGGNNFDHFNRATDLTMDWTEQCVTFNSLDHNQARVYLGLWGGKKGKIWWDDLRIEAVPLLNILRRDSLPVILESEDGTRFEEGRDYEPIRDPKLGRTPWPGSYETRHDPPVIQLTANSRIQNGQTIRFSGYHPTLVYAGQVNCSLSDPIVFQLCREQIRRTEAVLHPDIYFMSHDEIRCAGWEPDQIRDFPSTGAVLAQNIQTCTDIIKQEAPGRPIVVWSDMFDPNHNAHDKYYLVNNTLANSWEGLTPDIIIMKWGTGAICRPGLQFFANRGHTQMLAAYYDNDVHTDYRAWQSALADIPRIEGIMYTTWQNNYANLEKFASAWWGYQP